MTECTKLCIPSRSFEFATLKNLAIIDTSTDGYKAACVVCDKQATIICATCYCVVYCDKICLLTDYERHEMECKLHCPRLWAYRRFERHSLQTVRFKHTGDPSRGMGMFARCRFAPGDRVLEDCVQFNSRLVNDALETKDFSRFGYLEPYIMAIYGDLESGGADTFAMHSRQIMALTGGYQGSWSTIINHSCLPNCVMMASACKEFILVTAIRPIMPHEEITIAYGGIAYAPLRIRTPILTQLLGTPCQCDSCVHPTKAEEHARCIVWDVIQHSRGTIKTDLFALNRRISPVNVVNISNRIIDVARTLLGATPQYADPWLAMVECAVLEFVDSACKIIKSPSLFAHRQKLQRSTKETTNHLGICARILILD